MSAGRAVLSVSPASSTTSTSSNPQGPLADTAVLGGSGQQPQSQQQQPVNGTENQQEAISAIVQMFKSAEAEFEQKTLLKDKHPPHSGGGGQALQQHQIPSPLTPQSSSDIQPHQTESVAIVCSSSNSSHHSSIIASASGNNNNLDVAAGSQLLPTVPVPPSSLLNRQMPAAVGGRVTLNLKPNLSGLQESTQQQQLVKVMEIYTFLKVLLMHCVIISIQTSSI